MAKTKTAPTKSQSGGKVRNVLGVNANNLVRSALEQYAILPENRALFKEIQKLEAEIADRDRWRDVTAEEREQIIADSLHFLQLKHYERCQAKRKETAKKLDQAKAQWEKANVADAASRLIAWQKSKAELTLMTKDEILHRLETADASVDPDFLFAAAEYCAQTYNDLLPNVKSAISATNAAQPWLRNETIKELHDLSQAYDVQYGQLKLTPAAAGTEIVEDIQNIFEERK